MVVGLRVGADTLGARDGAAAGDRFVAGARVLGAAAGDRFVAGARVLGAAAGDRFVAGARVLGAAALGFVLGVRTGAPTDGVPRADPPGRWTAGVLVPPRRI